MNKQEVREDTIRQIKELIDSRIEKVGAVMDDHDGGQMEAYENCLKDLDVYLAILRHSETKRTDDWGTDYVSDDFTL
jgi:hypothetical protein